MSRRVAIIGAGIAGLTAAQRLHEYGLTATIFEASNRIGGRIHTVPFGNSNVNCSICSIV